MGKRMTPLFVFTADTHLEDGAWSTRPGIYGDSYYSFQQIADYCVEHKLPLVLGGDVLEKKSNSARPIAKLCAALSKLEAHGVPVYYIQGNHEYDRNAPWLSVHAWAQHLHGKTVWIDGNSMYGLDWLPRGEIQTALAAIPDDVDILITHQVWEDLMKGIGRTECTLTDVHNVQTVLAGDFHVTQIVEGTNAQGKPVRMLSPGSTCMQDCSESPDKFFFVIGREHGGQIAFEQHQLETRNFLSYQVRDQALLDELCVGKLDADIAALPTKPGDISKPIVRIKFDKSLPDAFLRLTMAAGDSCHLFCEALTDKGQSSKVVTRGSSKNDLLAALTELLGEDSAEYKLAAAMVTAEDPTKELDRIYNDYLTAGDEHAIASTGSAELGASPAPCV